uniref:Uncharacterized protein n=1 Tax=Cacopsylla melanoneura TaxID=428564 RepID=A0A8D8QZ02_9HEMI
MFFYLHLLLLHPPSLLFFFTLLIFSSCSPSSLTLLCIIFSPLFHYCISSSISLLRSTFLLSHHCVPLPFFSSSSIPSVRISLILLFNSVRVLYLALQFSIQSEFSSI